MKNLRLLVRIARRLLSRVRHSWHLLRKRLARKKTVVIHVPKCGGRALNVALKKSKSYRIQWVGHSQFHSLQLQRRYRTSATRWVALTRNPENWYRSRVTFLRQNIVENPHRKEFTNPYNLFAALADYGRLSLDEFVRAVSDPRAQLPRDSSFWNAAPPEFLETVNWLEKTNNGIFTLTILDHCGSAPFSQIDTPARVEAELHEIAERFSFIRNEHLETDSRNYLGIELENFEVVGSSEDYLKPSDKISSKTREILKRMDGIAASLTGGYELS